MATISGSKRLLNISSDAMAASNSMTYGGLNVATESYVSTQISNLISSAPGALDTLNELAAALGDDPNFATTMTNALAGKLATTHDMTLTLNGDASGSATFTNMGNATLTVTVSNDSHTHDGRYYTETEVNNLLAGKLSTTAKAADSNLLDGLDSSRFLYTSSTIFSGDWNTLTDSDYEIQLREVHNITGGAHSNYPEGVYTYGSVLAWQLASGTFKLYASHTGDLVFQTGWNNDGYSGWREIWHTGNFNPSSYLTTSGKAADSNLLDGINSTSFLRSDANDSASGNITFSGTITHTGNLVLQGASPTISILDTDSSADDFYIHVNSNNFYVLRDTAGADNVNSGWDSPHPLQLEGDTNKAYIFGNLVGTAAYANTGAFDSAGSASTAQANAIQHADDRIENEVLPAIPTDNSQLANGAGYVTSSGNTIIGTDSDINTSGYTVVDTLTMTDGVITAHGTRQISNLRIPDTRAAEKTPDDYQDYGISSDFTDEFGSLGAWYSGITLKGWHDGYAAWQLIGGSNTSVNQNWYLRSGVGATWSTMNRIWHSGDFSSTNVTNWNTAYDNYITGISITGTTTKTITLTQRDGGTISDTFTDLSGAGGDGNDFLVNGAFDPGAELLTLEVANQGVIEIPLPGVMTDTDTNTWRGIHDTPVDGATTTSISSNWAFDNVKTPVPANAVFTDNNTTYTAGTGLTLTGTEFSVTAGTYAAASHSHDYLPLSGGSVTGLTTFSNTVLFSGSTVLGAQAFYTHTVSVGDADGADNKWILKKSDGQNVTVNDTNNVYRIRLVTTGTGTNTGAVYICDNVDGAGWRTKKVSSVDTGNPDSNHPFVEIEGGLPKVSIQHNNNYNVKVIIEEFNGGNNGASYELLGLDSGITNENGKLVFNTVDNTTTDTTALMISTSGNVLKRTLGSAAFSSTGDFAPSSHNHSSLDLTGSIYNGSANYSIDLKDHSDRTWFRNQAGGWTFQAGSSGDDWTQSFTFYLPAAGSTANNVWAEFGQRDSNDAAAGRYRGLRIVKDTGSVADGDLRAGAIYIGSARKDAEWTAAYNWGNHASAGYLTSVPTTLSGNRTIGGDLTVSGNQVITAGSNADVKFSVWSGTTYGIGMTSGVTYGGLNDYAMTFCMNNDSDRGFWWGYSGQSKSAGAMSLTTGGILTVASSITAGGDITAFSDVRVKENIEDLEGSLDKVTQLRGVSYNRIDAEERSIGVIAQEIQEVLPEVVREGQDGMLSVAYGNITAVLIEAIKEQQEIISQLEERIVDLENRM